MGDSNHADADLAIDYPLVMRGRARLDEAAGRLDARGARAPSGEYGAGAGLVALALGAHADAATSLVAEARVLALAVGKAIDDVSGTDAQQALAFFRVECA